MSTTLKYNENNKSKLTKELYIKPSYIEEEFSSYYKQPTIGNNQPFPIKYLILLVSLTLITGFWLLWKTTKSRREFIQNSDQNFY